MLNRVYTTDEMVKFMSGVDSTFVEYEEVEGIVDAITVRLQAQHTHIKMLQERIDLAEKVIGELYLTNEEVSR